MSRVLERERSRTPVRRRSPVLDSTEEDGYASERSATGLAADLKEAS